MRRATTPKHTFTLPETVPINTVTDVLITYSQCGKKILEKTMKDVGIVGNAFILFLTQDETNKFAPGKALIQVRVKGRNERILASQMIWLTVKPVLESEDM